jgi:hypothetical protein
MDQAFTATQTFLINPTKKQGGPRDVGFLSLAKDSAFVKRGLDLSTVVGMDTSESMPKAARQTVLVYTHVDTLAANHHVAIGYMNQTNWIPQAEPLIYLSREQWDEHQFMPEVKANKDWVDIVINNIDDRGYPFHLVCSLCESSPLIANWVLARPYLLCPHSPCLFPHRQSEL